MYVMLRNLLRLAVNRLILLDGFLRLGLVLIVKSRFQ